MEEKEEKRKNANFARKFVENQENKEEKEVEKSVPKTETLDPTKGLYSVVKAVENSGEEMVEEKEEIAPQDGSYEKNEAIRLLTELMETQEKHGKLLKEQEVSQRELKELLKHLDKTLNLEENAEMVYTIVKRTQSLLEKHQESLESVDVRFTAGMDASFKSMKVSFKEYIACIHEAHQKVVSFSNATNGFLEKEREVVKEEIEKEEKRGFSFELSTKRLIKLGIFLLVVTLVVYFLRK